MTVGDENMKKMSKDEQIKRYKCMCSLLNNELRACCDFLDFLCERYPETDKDIDIFVSLRVGKLKLIQEVIREGNKKLREGDGR
jgi:hypothetical protein